MKLIKEAENDSLKQTSVGVEVRSTIKDVSKPMEKGRLFDKCC